ncbi:TonB-dependent receptor [Bacteroidaceae bacterium HV4-6-C5C]|nr:TonB-dependent receptor [Bacteroidaceae bacterium HV4-6-C5C]
MKKHAMTACLLMAALGVCAQTHEKDSLRIVNLQEVEIISTRATSSTPVAFTNVNKEQLKKQNFGLDLPYLLSMTPSALTTSDAGAGVGYTSLRVRGTDATRINVTTNGIPLNDAESHAVFWVNMPDFASSVKDVQIQRGAGTSTNGAGAFGGSVNIQTGDFSLKPYAELSGSYGSFNTHKETVKVGTGLMDGHWSFDARLSNIGTDGYVDRAKVDLNSYYLQGGYFTDNTSIKLITFGGKERTYHAWNYASQEQMDLFGRTFNSCGYMYVTDKKGVVHPQSEYDFDYNTADIYNIVKDGGKIHYYEDQTDNYTQTHYQLLINHNFNSKWNLNAGLHYTKGDGFYQEYKGKRKLQEYGLIPYTVDGNQISKSDLIRKKVMDNWFGGGVFSFNYTGERLAASLGGGLNRYDGDHFGKILWVKNYIGNLDPDKDYYRNNATKNDGNIYLKANYVLGSGVSAYGDLQYRFINYKMNGQNDNWNDATNALQQLDLNKNFSFFNPKAGLLWKINNYNKVYGSFSVAHKEPTRNNYTDGKLTDHPKAERLFDYELGYAFANSWFNAGLNLYYMDYKDQLVLTGELNEIGEAIAANAPKSYRAGVEIMAGIKLPCGFQWDANATLSRNRIKNFVETLYGYDDNYNGLPGVKVNHGTTHIAFSPDIMLNNRFAYLYKGLEVALQSQYVGKQYMSNADIEAHKLDSYFVSNLNMAYTFKLPRTKSVTIGFTVYNLFNEKYENNGWASSDYTNNVSNRNNHTGYAAQAGSNILANISLSF